MTDLLATLADIATGDTGGPWGVTDFDDAPFPFTLDATTEITYAVPLERPVNVHELPPTIVQRAVPGIATATYVVSGWAFCHETTAPESIADTFNCWTRTDDAGTCNKRFVVCGLRKPL